MTIIDDQNAAAIRILTEQVAVLSDAVRAQAALIQGVRNHNLALLDDVKKARRAAKAATEALAEERDRLSAST
jgi:hypothetical protein